MDALEPVPSAKKPRKKRGSRVELGSEQRVGANIDAVLYNELLNMKEVLGVEFSWIVRAALGEFVARNLEAVRDNPVQFVLELNRKLD
jgi:hypothetical protein